MSFLTALLPIAGSLLGGLFGGSSTSSDNKSTNSKTTQTGTSTTSGSTLNKPSESGLTSALLALLGGGASQGSDSLTKLLSGDATKATTFDPAAYVKGVTDSGRQDINDQLDSTINGLLSGVGSNAGNNSAAALLADKARRAGASTLAGITSQATANADQIVNQNKTTQVNDTTAITGQFTNLLTSILGGLKGASVSQTSSTNDTSKTVGNGTDNTSTTGFDAKSAGLFGDVLTGIFNSKF